MEEKEAKLKEKQEKKEEKMKNKEQLKAIKKEIKAKKTQLKEPISDKVVIFTIVGGVLFIAALIFGFFLYKTNMEAVVKFDGGKVIKSEYTTYYKAFSPMLGYYGYPEYMIPDQIAQKAAIDKVLLLEAKNAGVTISDEDMAKVNETFADEKQIESIKKQGISIDSMKQLYMNDYIINAYIASLEKKLSSEEVASYIKKISGQDTDMNEYNTRHILFKVESTAKEEEKNIARNKAQDILNRALAGEDFITLAKDNSEDTNTAKNGGVFKLYMDNTVMEEYVNAIKGLTIGKIYPTLVETEAGFHIIKLDSIIENGRVNNSNERRKIVDEDINKKSENKNVIVNKKVLNKLVEQITGKPVQTEEEYKKSNNSSQVTSNN
ncbi:MAG: peptidylprolyl isomerase [Clostridia bacterium]